MVYVYSGILFYHKKEWNNTIQTIMDGPRDYHTKWSKSDKDKYHEIAYPWNLKQWYKWTYLTKQQQTCTDFAPVSDGKDFTCNVGDPGLILGLRRSLEGRCDNPLQYSCLENPHAQRSLVGYSACGPKESDTTERLCTIDSHRKETYGYQREKGRRGKLRVGD